MIISCPECAGPFEVPDDQIAALVQLQCPHCAFRMILDFAAANDPGLVEQGMKMASGYRSAADYRASLAGPAVAATPERPVEAVPEPETEPAVAVAAARAEAPTPAPLEVAARAEAPTPRVTPPPADEDEIAVRVPSPAQEVAVHAPDADDELDVDVDEEAATMAPPSRVPPTGEPAVTPRSQPAPSPSRPAVAEEAPAPRVAARQAQPEEAPAEDDSPSGRQPPHTPPGRSATSRTSDDDAEAAKPKGPARKRPRLEAFDDLEPPEATEQHMSTFGVIVLVVLLLAALGLVGASMALENTPDPRPLLEDLYRQYVKGQ